MADSNLTVKPSAEIVTFQKQPQRFLELIGSQLETFQKVYRTKLPADELVMWRETLKDYSVQEFETAFAELVRYPPKYQLEDGSVQVWRGMPKLPDVVNVMLDLRDKAVYEARKRESERRRMEFAALEKRRAEHPEEFMSWGDFCARLKTEKPELAAKMGMSTITNDAPEPTEEELSRRRDKMVADLQRKLAAK
jgi:hypothetical protein